MFKRFPEFNFSFLRKTFRRKACVFTRAPRRVPTASLQRPYSVPSVPTKNQSKTPDAPSGPATKPSKTAFQQCRFHICASRRKLAIIDPFKPCPGTADGINFANLRRWVIYINLWSVRSPRSPLCKVESWQRTARWPAQGEVWTE